MDIKSDVSKSQIEAVEGVIGQDVGALEVVERVQYLDRIPS